MSQVKITSMSRSQNTQNGSFQYDSLFFLYDGNSGLLENNNYTSLVNEANFISSPTLPISSVVITNMQFMPDGINFNYESVRYYHSPTPLTTWSTL
jgi:hypothetical protein